uniref:Uncharacterized protein n=1 Tax=Prolemur simus TaxID=1328070 RepID=A0A8C8ZJY3_PROSS
VRIHLQDSLLDSSPWSAFSHSPSAFLVSSRGPSGLKSCVNFGALARLAASLELECPLPLRWLPWSQGVQHLVGLESLEGSPKNDRLKQSQSAKIKMNRE